MNSLNKRPEHLKKTILITDSGLGGLSVFARIADLLAQKSPWPDISMIYFNAWPEQNRGYNHFETMEQKARVFNNALNVMDRFNPDIILIACNTLSVIYPFTPYSRKTGTMVSGIVDHGVQLIHKNLTADPDSPVIIFGTPTTITEKTHQRKLMQMGIDRHRITPQGCTDLAGKIERNPFSRDVSKMIHSNVSIAASKIDPSAGKVYAALCCTHFGYCKTLFQDALSDHLKKDVIILNPNERMADSILNDQVMEHWRETGPFPLNIDMQVVSRVFWEPDRIDAYARLLKNISSETVNALADYKWNPTLFEV